MKTAVSSSQNLNPQNLRPGEGISETDGHGLTMYYLGFACGTSLWQANFAWTVKDRQRAKTTGCGLCCSCEE